MEAQSECDYKDQDDGGDPQEGVEDVVEDGDVLAEDGDLAQVDEQVDPGEGDHEGT